MVNLILWLKKHTPLNMTYHWEAVFVGIILCITGLMSDKGWIEWVGVVAVFFTFMHASVAERLAESEGYRKTQGEAIYVDCYYKLPRYFYIKEACYFVYFILLGAWSAVVGVFIFLAYPIWRKYWRKHNPIR